MQRRFAIAVALSVLALAGCGGGGTTGGGSSGGGGGSEAVAGVRTTMHELVNDLLAGNYGAVCGLVTPAAKAKVGGSNCATLIGEAMTFSSSGQRAKVQQEAGKIDSTAVSVNGDTATVPSTTGSSPTTFVRQGGRWLISGGVSGG